MKKEIAVEWVKALRSGRYQQGKRSLMQTDTYDNPVSFCCLGVLCDISQQGVWKSGKYASLDGRNSNENVLPWNVQGWSETSSDDGSLPDDRTMYGTGETLAHLNDKGYTFEQIADIIEKYWEKL